MLGNCFTIFMAIMAVICSIGSAYDPDPLQVFCVAVDDSKAAVFVKGMICKDPKIVTPNNFFISGLNQVGNISSPIASEVTKIFDDQLLGLNTLGISLVRIDYAPYGLNPLSVTPKIAYMAAMDETDNWLFN